MAKEVEQFGTVLETDPDAAFGFKADATAVLCPAALGSVPDARALPARQLCTLQGPPDHPASASVPLEMSLPGIGSIAGTQGAGPKIVAVAWDAGRMAAGELSADTLRATAGTEALPWSMHLQLLWDAVRGGDFRIRWGTDRDAAALVVRATGPIPLQWVLPLTTPVVSPQKDGLVAHASRLAMAAHSVSARLRDQHRRARVEAEAALQRSLVNPGAAGGPVPTKPARRDTDVPVRRPQSLLNPTQQAGGKRPRGVKFGK